MHICYKINAPLYSMNVQFIVFYVLGSSIFIFLGLLMMMIVAAVVVVVVVVVVALDAGLGLATPRVCQKAPW